MIMNKVPDATIIQKVTKQLSNHGMRAPCRIAVAARKGDVTLTGTIQFEHQRIAALHAVRGVDGVRRVMDQLKVQAKAVQKIITLQRPIAEIAAPVMEIAAPATENVTPAMEKTAPVNAGG
jgi:hypothetical protein